MKSVTCFICGLSSGGAEHQMSILTELLVSHGFDVELVTFADVPDHYALAAGVKRVRLAEGKSKLRKYFSMFLYFVQLRTDCVISFGRRENELCLLPLIFRPRIKVLAGERNFTAGRDTLIDKVLINCLYRRADYIVPNSCAQREHILSNHPNWANKVRVITNYTDLSVYRYREPVHHARPRIGVFARYTKQKNYMRFAEAVKCLKKRIGASFLIDWYGNMMSKNILNEEYVKFKNYIEKNDLADVLILNNHIKDVSSIMSEFDAICLPSLWEGFSNSISEAICCGKPMLVSDVSDNSTMVHNGINGFTFNPYDVSDIANALYRFLNLSKEERAHMAVQSRIIAEKLFDRDLFVESYIDLINRQ